MSEAGAVALPRQRHTRPTMLTAFQTGHGWASGGTGITWNVNDTTLPYAGSQSVSFVTAGSGGLSWVQSPVVSAIDFTTVDVTVWIYIASGLANLRRIQPVFTSDNFTNYVQGNVYDGGWPQPPSSELRQGEWFPLRFNIGQLAAGGSASGAQTQGAPTLTAIDRVRLTLQDFGAGAVTGYIGAVEYSARPSVFPNGVVSLTFDDTFASTYAIAAPYLADYGYAGSEYVIQSIVGASGSQMTLAQLQALEAVYGWECCAHAYTLADHDAGLDTLSAGQVEYDLSNMKLWLIQNGFRGYDQFAYPLGHLAATDQQVGKYFATARTLYTNPNELQRPAVPLRLRASEATGSSATAINALIDAAQAEVSWLIIVFHDIVAANPTGSAITTAAFKAIIDHINAKAIDCAPVGDVWRAMA